jgi:DnaD/phage-associated family protein
MSWITDYNATPEMIVYAYSYSVRKKNHSNPKYVAAIVKEWANLGLKPSVRSRVSGGDRQPPLPV